MATPPSRLPPKPVLPVSKGGGKKKSSETDRLLATKMKSPASIEQIAEQSENKGKDIPKKTADDIRTLLRSFSLTSPKASALTTFGTKQPLTSKGAKTTGPSSLDKTLPLLDHLPPLPSGSSSSSIESIAAARDKDKLPALEIKGLSISSDKPVMESKETPLPIGTEKRLGLINKATTNQREDSKPDKWYQTSNLWSKAKPAPFEPFSDQLPSGSMPEWRKAEQGLHYRVEPSSTSYTRPETWPNRQIGKAARDQSDPFTDCHNETASQGMNAQRSTRASSNPILQQASPHSQGVPSHPEELTFSEMIASPGYGGYEALSNYQHQNAAAPRRDYGPLTQSPQQWMDSSPDRATHYAALARSAQQNWENAAATQGLRRSSVPVSVWRQQVSNTPVHPPRQAGRRSFSYTTGDSFVEEELITPREEQGVTPMYRFTTPGPERHGEDGTIIQRTPGSRQSSGHLVQYNNSGILPATWPDLEQGPPAPLPFTPGDWTCTQPMCNYHNFQRNAECRSCGHPRPWDMIVSHDNPPLGSVGDWRCECGYINRGSASSSTGNARGMNSQPLGTLDMIYSAARNQAHGPQSLLAAAQGGNSDGQDWPPIGSLTSSRTAHNAQW
ncbi:hypothetical protein CI109_100769 [Kwoniella shandongensis]|uniref:RanBP2-type domain-containing protein n=1 Tax=Kwoniella shandongensis TaxID=1734106 RepID=A0AAJ8MUQ0_9TREE